MNKNLKGYLLLSLMVLGAGCGSFAETIKEMAERIGNIPAKDRYPEMQKLTQDQRDTLNNIFYLQAKEKRLAAMPKRTSTPAGAVLYREVIEQATDVPVDIYKITQTVRVQNPPRFGANFLGLYSFKPWYNSRAFNTWNESYAMEPITIRETYIIEGQEGPENDQFGINKYWYKWGIKGQPAREGFSGFKAVPSGVWDGADLYLYRMEKDETSYHLIHQTTVKAYTAEPQSDGLSQHERVEFSDPLPKGVESARIGDVVVLKNVVDEVNITDPAQQRKKEGFFESYGGAFWKIDRTTQCAEGGSTASMKVTVPGGEEAGMQHQMLSRTPVGQSWLELSEGAEYKAQIWLRQEGLASGKVTIDVAGMVAKTFDVTDEWQKFEFDVPNAQDQIPVAVGNLSVSSVDHGTFWIDNFLIWQTDTPQFAMLPSYLNALKEFRPDNLRIWVPYSQRSMDMALSHGWQGMSRWSSRGRVDANDGRSMHSTLKVCQDVGADPWIVLYAAATEAEINDLMEYLGAPSTVGKGKLRASHGQEQPWAEVFGQIILECNNEPWGKGYGPYAPHPEVYAGMANHMFKIVKSSDYYDADQVVCLLGGRSGQEMYQKHFQTGEYLKNRPWWSLKTLLLADQADGTDAAYYFGGADGLTILGVDDEDFFGKQLLYVPRVLESKADNVDLMRKEVADLQNGREIKFALYEGGPGYPPPSGSRPFTEEGERVGKSLALGVVTLDAYMLAQDRGFLALDFFKFAMGNNFTSHHSHNDMFAWPAWKALQLRNIHCSGDLMVVKEEKVKTVDFPAETVEKENYNGKSTVKRTIDAKKEIPFTRCYAFQDGKKHSFILINRHYNEARPIQLKLPYNPSSTLKIYALTADDPGVSCREEDLVLVQEETRDDFTRDYTFIAAPSSVYVLVNEEQ